MNGVSLLNIQLTSEYLQNVSEHLSASVMPSFACNAFKFRTAHDGFYFLHPLLDDIFFTDHCVERYKERRKGNLKVGVDDILERAYPERYVTSGKEDLDSLVHSFVMSVLNGGLEFIKGKGSSKVKAEDSIIIRLEKKYKVAVFKYGPFFLFKTFLNVGELDETQWIDSSTVLDPYKALQRMFKVSAKL
jgi:hypothetical protein